MGELFRSMTRVTPTATFMYGPIDSEIVPKKVAQRRQKQQKDAPAELVQAQEVSFLSIC